MAGVRGRVFFSRGGSPSVALDVHLEDGCVVDEPIDDGQGHGWIGKDLPHSPNGWFAVMSTERRS